MFIEVVIKAGPEKNRFRFFLIVDIGMAFIVKTNYTDWDPGNIAMQEVPCAGSYHAITNQYCQALTIFNKHLPI